MARTKEEFQTAISAELQQAIISNLMTQLAAEKEKSESLEEVNAALTAKISEMEAKNG